MDDTTSATLAGGAGGAGSGAATGYAVGGAPGAAIGAAIGLGVGGGAGYLGAKGASKRKKAAKRARQQYEEAIRRYEAEARKALEDQRANISKFAAQDQALQLEHLKSMPADQSAALAQSALNQQAALAAPQAALSGPLGNVYNKEFAGRTQSALAPMALNYAENDVSQAALSNDRNFDLQRAALSPEMDRAAMNYNLAQAQRDQNLNRARAQFGVYAGGNNTGSEQMMYGGMLTSLASLGGQMGQQYASDQRYEDRRNQYYEDLASKQRGRESVGVLRPNSQSGSALTPPPNKYYNSVP